MKRWKSLSVILGLISYLLMPLTAQAAACTPATYDEGSYRFVIFNSSATCDWIIPTGVRSINYLVVGGGGGGASRHGGGGGAGGLLQGTGVTVNWGATLSITVGGGGSGAGTGGGNGSHGNDSVLTGGTLGTITALKGGGGGTQTASGSNTVGSGGGATGTGSIGYGTSGQGANGGLGNGNYGCPGSTTQWCGGGGGGSSDNGSASTSSGAGKGGNGLAISWISTSIATSCSCGDIRSTSVYFAAGGGGGTDVGGTIGAGGYGGGGAGSAGATTATNGSPLTGGGGGGAGYNGGSNGTAGNGGSGVVIIRYLNDTTAPVLLTATSQSIAENTAITSNAALITVDESATITITGGVDFGDVTLVRIDNTNAGIRFATVPNFESPVDSDVNNIYQVNIRATDEYGNIRNQAISITVTNVNEAPTISSNSSNPTWSTSQSENTSLVLDFDGTDVDAGATLTWSISGTDAADFSMNGSTGVLAFASGPDFEAPLDSNLDNIYIVVVTLSDGALTDTSTITITVTNLNESISPDSPAISGTPYKGVSISITVKTYVSGKVRFYVGGKRIPNCLNISTSNSYPNATATCNWKPSIGGKNNIYASITPSDNTFSVAASPIASFFVLKRTGTRG